MSFSIADKLNAIDSYTLGEFVKQLSIGIIGGVVFIMGLLFLVLWSDIRNRK